MRQSREGTIFLRFVGKSVTYVLGQSKVKWANLLIKMVDFLRFNSYGLLCNKSFLFEIEFCDIYMLQSIYRELVITLTKNAKSVRYTLMWAASLFLFFYEILAT